MAQFLLSRFNAPADDTPVRTEAERLIHQIRDARSGGAVDALMREYDLSSAEGLVLMELAEALLRIPDAATRDALIRDKLGSADWTVHAGHSSSLLVNLSTLGFGFGSRLLAGGSVLSRLAARIGAPVIRTAVLRAMGFLGDRFVFAESMPDAVRRAERDLAADPLARHSFDMLGESARTREDAKRYRHSYSQAIVELAKVAGADVYARSGISIKLSALNPRYEPQRLDQVRDELLPVLTQLAEQAAAAGIGFTIDAEEAERLDMSLDLFEMLAFQSSLAGWQGLGLAVQAYQKRALPVIDWVAELGRRSRRRIMVRLVKGAYWDSEIKRAQIEGLDDYPVYTRKVLTDLSYLACARSMLAADDAIYPMFATHNAYSVAAIRHMAGSSAHYEFQRLHGMGDELYRAAAGWGVPCRVYAPVGEHRDLLAYLVRRLLENGANSSFVTQLADRTIPVERLAENPANAVRILGTVISNPRIPAPTDLYDKQRLGAPGVDFGNADDLAALTGSIGDGIFEAHALIGSKPGSMLHRIRIVSPADHTVPVGEIIEASLSDVAEAVRLALHAQPAWSARPVSSRARVLERAADLLVEERARFITLLVREAGRTLKNAIGEWREAIDFLRFYAAEAERLMIDHALPGPTGERNTISLHGKGVFACISPWNFPLSIFLGQVSAALVTGNAVLAKPAGETPLIGFEAVRLLHRAGVPEEVLHFLPGGPEIGAEIVAQVEIAGVVFTGSTVTARKINGVLAGRQGPLATLIAETGGQNVMIVDSSALIEQAVGDIVASAYDSAGQRCSALRILAVQEDIAEPLIAMLQGAVALLKLGDPADPVTDIGPVISEPALRKLQAHLEEPSFAGTSLFPASLTPLPRQGTFMAPQLLEIKALADVTEEVFGPVLHVMRWKSGQLEPLIESINNLGYGLTLAVQTRIDSTVETVTRLARVGNLYINRGQIGAVVGSQPFGGEGLSGTGPKAGGAMYLQRFVTERVVTVNTAAAGGNATLLSEAEL